MTRQKKDKSINFITGIVCVLCSVLLLGLLGRLLEVEETPPVSDTPVEKIVLDEETIVF